MYHEERQHYLKYLGGILLYSLHRLLLNRNYNFLGPLVIFMAHTRSEYGLYLTVMMNCFYASEQNLIFYSCFEFEP